MNKAKLNVLAHLAKADGLSISYEDSVTFTFVFIEKPPFFYGQREKIIINYLFFRAFLHKTRGFLKKFTCKASCHMLNFMIHLKFQDTFSKTLHLSAHYTSFYNYP